VAEKIRTARQADNGLLEAESAVLVEVNGKFRKLQETRQLLQVSQLAQETARETVRITTNRYGQQTILLQSVLQAQTSLAEADYQYEQALLAFWNARAELDKAMGEDQ
jgi:outer membrane protein TolC